VRQDRNLRTSEKWHARSHQDRPEAKGFSGSSALALSFPLYSVRSCNRGSRNRADSVPAARALCAIRLDGGGNLADRPRARGHKSAKTTSSEPQETSPSGATETGLKQKAARHPVGKGYPWRRQPAGRLAQVRG
jgi:hypothetical protein